MEKKVRWSSLLEIGVKGLGIEINNKVCWHARGTTMINIVRGMHKDETLGLSESYSRRNKKTSVKLSINPKG
ncbi:Protein of unknown function [Bacillus cereus]|nr:Protein of unknown function [Bacillus cereus]